MRTDARNALRYVRSAESMVAAILTDMEAQNPLPEDMEAVRAHLLAAAESIALAARAIPR